MFQVTEKQQKGSRRLALNDNVQLLQELQVAQQDGKATARQLEAVQAELRDMQTRYKILEARVKGAPAESSSLFRGGEADVGASSPRGSVSMAGRVVPSRPSSAYPGSATAASGTRSSWSAAPAGSRPTSAAAPTGGGSGASARPSSSSSYRFGRMLPGLSGRQSPQININGTIPYSQNVTPEGIIRVAYLIFAGPAVAQLQATWPEAALPVYCTSSSELNASGSPS